MLPVLTKQILPQTGLIATAISTDTTTDGAEIDTKGYDSALVITTVHVYSAGTVTPVINQTATSGSGYTAVDDAFLVNEANESLTALGHSVVGVSLRERYLEVDLLSADSADLTASVMVILYNARKTPVA